MTENREPIIIVLQTFKRTSNALRTIAAAVTNLRYDGELQWYVADDGSPARHYEEVLNALQFTNADVIGSHSERLWYGGNCNAAYDSIRHQSELSFWLEDDWELRAELDLTPYADLLMRTEEIGMVRLGYLNADIRGRTWPFEHRMYWKLDREPHLEGACVFTGHPSLRHTRYWDTYGYYPVVENPGQTELDYALQFRKGPTNGPGIVWPAWYPSNGLFAHIGEVKTETMLYD